MLNSGYLEALLFLPYLFISLLIPCDYKYFNFLKLQVQFDGHAYIKNTCLFSTTWKLGLGLG